MTQITQGLSQSSRRILIMVGLIIGLVYLSVALLTDRFRLLDALRQLGARGSVAVLGLSLLNYLLRFQRWKYYLDRLGRHIPAGRHFLIYLSGFAFTVSPGKAGEAVRSLYLKDHEVPYPESLATLFVERLLDLCAIVVLASMVLIGYPAYRYLITITVGIFAVSLSIACTDWAAVWVEGRALRMTGRFRGMFVKLAELLHSSRRLSRPGPLLFGFVLGLLAWGAEGVGFYFICEALQISSSLPTFVGIYAMAVLVGSLSILLPAGIGSMEIVMVSILVERGVALSAAVIATLLCRLATLWFAVIIGIVAATAIELTRRSLRVGLAP